MNKSEFLNREYSYKNAVPWTPEENHILFLNREIQYSSLIKEAYLEPARRNFGNSLVITRKSKKTDGDLVTRLEFNSADLERVTALAAFINEKTAEYLRLQKEEKKKERELLKSQREVEEKQKQQEKQEELARFYLDCIYEVKGARGRTIYVYPNKVKIRTSITAGSLVTGNAINGIKTIYYQDMIGLQYKEPGLTLGYLQFETATSMDGNKNSDFFNENTFTFEAAGSSDAKKIYNYVEDQLDRIKALPDPSAFSSASQLEQYHDLMTRKIISEEEFQKVKNKLFG